MTPHRNGHGKTLQEAYEAMDSFDLVRFWFLTSWLVTPKWKRPLHVVLSARYDLDGRVRQTYRAAGHELRTSGQNVRRMVTRALEVLSDPHVRAYVEGETDVLPRRVR